MDVESGVVPVDIQVHNKEADDADPIIDGEYSDTQSNTAEDLSEVSDITNEQTPIVDVTPDTISPSKQYKAPEPPRWRFNRQSSIIKSSAGYSSAHAGSYIKGKSSEELGGRFALRACDAFFGADCLALTVSFGLALPLGLPRDRFTGILHLYVCSCRPRSTSLSNVIDRRRAHCDCPATT